MIIEKNKKFEKKNFGPPTENFFGPPAESKIYFFHLKTKIEQNKKIEKKICLDLPRRIVLDPPLRSIVLEQKEQLFSPIVDFLATAAT